MITEEFSSTNPDSADPFLQTKKMTGIEHFMKTLLILLLWASVASASEFQVDRDIHYAGTTVNRSEASCDDLDSWRRVAGRG